MSLKLLEPITRGPSLYETITTSLTDEEIRLEAVKIAQGGNMGACSVRGLLEDAKSIYDFIKTGETLKEGQEG
jgi:hypothetical protein